MKQFAPACERNKDAILAVLRDALPATGTVLEIGSGSGLHAAYFAQHLPQLVWQPSDRAESLASIAAWAAEAEAPNLRAPVELDLFAPQWPLSQADAIVCINTIHIVAWRAVENLFATAGRALVPGGVLYVYGPYRYVDEPLAASNIEFDRWLQARDPQSGIRDFAAVNALAAAAGLALVGDVPMPANNRSIWWRKPMQGRA